MTVAELIVELQKYSPNAEVRGEWDSYLWEVHQVYVADNGMVVIDVDSHPGSRAVIGDKG